MGLSKKIIDDSYEAIRDLYKKGKIEDDLFDKKCLDIASDYAQNGYVDECVSLLSGIPSDFLLTKVDKSLKDDPIFLDSVFKLCKILVSEGHLAICHEEKDKVEDLNSLMYLLGNVAKA